MVSSSDLIDLGRHPYLRYKDLCLFAWGPDPLPDPGSLSCTSMISTARGSFPEFDRFGIFTYDDALGRVGRGLASLLGQLRPRLVTMDFARSRCTEDNALPD